MRIVGALNSYIFSDERFRSFSFLPEQIRTAALALEKQLTCIRLRPEKPVQLVYPGGDELIGKISRACFEDMVLALMGHSLYARQQELDEGFFMLADGSRAGICGRYTGHGPRSISDISSVCIRIARQIKGCADMVMPVIDSSRGSLIVSPPGLGKTTLLRDIARQLSETGKTVCIIDERGEIAACSDGISRLDVGPRTDVITGMNKHTAIILAVRSCAPDVIVTDEIGDERDAFALAEALRSGVRVVATVHGSALNGNSMRLPVRNMLSQGLFDAGILLGPALGQIAGTCSYSDKGSDGFE